MYKWEEKRREWPKYIGKRGLFIGGKMDHGDDEMAFESGRREEEEIEMMMR
jgi:hypothetical protein